MGRHARSTPRASSRGAGSTVDGPRARGSLRRGPDMVSSEARSRGNARASGAGWRVATHRQSDYGRPGARRLECRAMTTSSVFRLAAPAVMGALWVAGCGGGKSDPAPSDSLGARTNAAPALALAAAVAPSATDDPAVVAAYRNSFYDDADILHSFQTTVGETIDCIDFYAQRSVKGLVAQGQRPDITKLPKPPPLPGGVPEANVPSHFAFDGSPDLNGNARQCPPGAVAVTRPSVTDITAAGGLEKFKATRRRRPVPSGSQSTFENDCWLNNAPGNGLGFPTYNYDHAVGIVRNINYYGLLTIMPVYAGFIEVAGEHDVSQFWVQTGKCENWYRTSGQGNQCATGNGVNNQAVQSVEGGWVVDNNQQIAKLFMFMTGDGYYQDNCYAGSDGVGDTVCCPGGVSNPSPGQQGTSCWVAAPNAAFTVNESLPTSTAEKPPWELGIQVWNGSTANPPAPGWWVWVNGNNLIGW